QAEVLLRRRRHVPPAPRRTARRVPALPGSGRRIDHPDVQQCLTGLPGGLGFAPDLSQDGLQVGPELDLLAGEVKELLQKEVQLPQDLAEPGLVLAVR